MKSNFRLKLFFIMSVFGIAISGAYFVIDHLRLQNLLLQSYQTEQQHLEEMVVFALSSLDNAYELFDEDMEKRMEENSNYLISLYNENQNFDTWDFKTLKEQLGMDIYIINEQGVITHSSFANDIGINFSVCCPNFNALLNERRMSGELFIDGMDIEQSTGYIKKYSYIATPDKKYLIELGIPLEHGEIFRVFNFLEVIKKLIEKYPNVNDINVVNASGYILAEYGDGRKLTGKREQAFREALRTKQTVELKHDWNGHPSSYRYIYYSANIEKGYSTNRVIEVIMNEDHLQKTLLDNIKTNVIQFFITLLISIFVASIISKWTSRPLHLAFHDSLTGLYNRAVFDEVIHEQIHKKHQPTALVLLDLDNFKLVNDELGHDKGDEILKHIAATLSTLIRKGDYAIRLGGDEFIIIMPNATKKEAIALAEEIISCLNASLQQMEDIKHLQLSTSIGIATSPEDGLDAETLFKKADNALYQSKKNGKNQYQLAD